VRKLKLEALDVQDRHGECNRRGCTERVHMIAKHRRVFYNHALDKSGRECTDATTERIHGFDR
jgi:hypothetical protein